MSDAKPEAKPTTDEPPKEKSKSDGTKKKIKKPKTKEAPKETSTPDAPQETTPGEAAKETINSNNAEKLVTEETQKEAVTEGHQINVEVEKPQNGVFPIETNSSELQPNIVEVLQEKGNGEVPLTESKHDVPQSEVKGDIPQESTPFTDPMDNLGMEIKQSDDPNFNITVENTKSGPPKVTSSFQVIPSDPEQLRLEEELRKKKMEDDDWLKEDATDAAPTEEVPAEDAPAPVEGEESAAIEEEALEDELEDEPPKRRIRSDRPLIFKYWKRPVFLQYAYLYDYRHNYYDDVMDYLDKRQRGITRDIPRAQTWAERALRTYNAKSQHTADYQKRERDINLLSDIRTSNRFYKYHHSKEYFTTKYSSIL